MIAARCSWSPSWANNREANASVVPRNFGRATVTGPAVVFTVAAANPLRDPARACGVSVRR